MSHAANTMPPAWQALAVLAHALRLQGDGARSALLLEALDRLRPDEPAVLRSLAAAELACGRPANALSALERLAMTGAIDTTFHLLRAQALVGLDRRDEAAAAMRACLDARREGAAP